MAKIGLKYPVAAPIEDGGTYGKGFVIAKAITANITPNNNDATLYADDGAAETDKSFRNATFSLNIDDLTQKVYADLLGHEHKAEGTGDPKTPETVIASSNDVAPFFGVGFYGKIQRNNKPFYQAKWLKKVQFSEPSDETKTKGDTTEFQTPTIEGTAYQLEDGTWKEQAEFATEAEARTWLETQAKISVSGGGQGGGGSE